VIYKKEDINKDVLKYLLINKYHIFAPFNIRILSVSTNLIGVLFNSPDNKYKGFDLSMSQIINITEYNKGLRLIKIKKIKNEC
jgi:hypothetical protein